MENLNLTPAQMQEKISQRGFKVMYYSGMFDQELRNIYRVIDPECPLDEQNINVLFKDLIKIDSDKGIEIMESILLGDSVLLYPKEFGSKEPWLIMGFNKMIVEQDEFIY